MNPCVDANEAALHVNEALECGDTALIHLSDAIVSLAGLLGDIRDGSTRPDAEAHVVNVLVTLGKAHEEALACRNNIAVATRHLPFVRAEGQEATQ